MWRNSKQWEALHVIWRWLMAVFGRIEPRFWWTYKIFDSGQASCINFLKFKFKLKPNNFVCTCLLTARLSRYRATHAVSHQSQVPSMIKYILQDIFLIFCKTTRAKTHQPWVAGHLLLQRYVKPPCKAVGLLFPFLSVCSLLFLHISLLFGYITRRPAYTYYVT